MVYSIFARLLDHLVVDIPLLLHNNATDFRLAHRWVCKQEVRQTGQNPFESFSLPIAKEDRLCFS